LVTSIYKPFYILAKYWLLKPDVESKAIQAQNKSKFEDQKPRQALVGKKIIHKVVIFLPMKKKHL
jgi:hypothetical protein